MDIINKLFRDNYLMGDGYHKSLEEINRILPLKVINIPSGSKFGTWTVPEEWVIIDAWIKLNGEKIIDFKKEPLSLMVYSQPIHKKMNKEELIKHLYYSDEQPEHVPYEFSFYEKDWGFGVKKEFVFPKKQKDCDPDMACETEFEHESHIPEGEYEVFIDSEFKPGIMEIGIHTIKGKTDREILIFAHLDHPWQANDNLSGVQTAIDFAERVKDIDHTVKIIFCPETIGSIAYAETQDISKVDFVIALDAIGNDNTLLIQKSYDRYARINFAIHAAVHECGISYRKGDFRLLLGSDEYHFNDPMVGIPGICLSRFPYDEYHTSADTPDIVKADMLKENVDVILKAIEIYEADYIPKRTQKGVLMRSSIGLQTHHKLLNRDLDYLWYDADGEKSILEIVLPLSLTFTQAYEFYNTLEKNGLIVRTNAGEKPVKKTKGKKHA